MWGDRMNAYKVSGRFKMGDNWMPFAIEVVAESEEDANEKGLSMIGSRHRTKRRNIEIGTIEGITAEEATSPVVQYHLGGSK
jgi:large subunit ribosomal protein LX